MIRKSMYWVVENIFKYSEHITVFFLIALSVIDISNVDDWKYKEYQVGKYFYYICVVIAILTGLMSLETKRKIKELEDENQKMSEEGNNLSNKIIQLENDIEELNSDFISLFNTQIAVIFYKLSFGANERISIYKHENDKFIILGRYSSNPVYTKIREKIYPDNEGFIQLAWENESGEHYIDNIPEPKNGNIKDYLNVICSSCSINKERVKSMRMRSRNYYSKSLNDITGMKRNAIIVIESTDIQKLNREKISEILGEQEKNLTIFMDKMKLKTRTETYPTQLQL
jgi:hypothetical protein